MLEPGATIGILGGGQLGRMLALAAARLGFKCHVYTPEADAPAFDVVGRKTCAAYDDKAALEAFADAVDVVTYEFENVPAETAAILAAHCPVRPDPAILQTTQDRLAEKNFITRLGIGTARYADVAGPEAVEAACAEIDLPAVLKTRRLGYDGKGQTIIRDAQAMAGAWSAIGAHPAILEAFVPFEREVSVVAARGMDGEIVCFDVTDNDHGDHILQESRAPSTIPVALGARARAITTDIAKAFGYVGVLAVEMFVIDTPAGPDLLVNEIAPRVHNSGHWTLDGCTVSQFEQHIRAVAGLPLGPAHRLGRVRMVNLIGADYARWRDFLGVPGACIHLYGKTSPRQGRKMGHVTIVTPE